MTASTPPSVTAALVTIDLSTSHRLQHPLVVISKTDNQPNLQSSQTVFSIPEIHTLAKLIEPFLTALQSQDIRSADWKTHSFLTTELNLSGKLLLEFLSPTGQILLKPYFKFLEDFVAIPWQRVCLAAANHTLTSPEFKIVERMLPKASEIAQAVYNQACQQFGGYYNRRGSLDTPAVKHSSLRVFIEA